MALVHVSARIDEALRCGVDSLVARLQEQRPAGLGSVSRSDVVARVIELGLELLMAEVDSGVRVVQLDRADAEAIDALAARLREAGVPGDCDGALVSAVVRRGIELIELELDAAEEAVAG